MYRRCQKADQKHSALLKHIWQRIRKQGGNVFKTEAIRLSVCAHFFEIILKAKQIQNRAQESADQRGEAQAENSEIKHCNRQKISDNVDA